MLLFGIMPAVGEEMIADMALSPGKAEIWYMIWHETCLLRVNLQNFLEKFVYRGWGEFILVEYFSFCLAFLICFWEL